MTITNTLPSTLLDLAVASSLAAEAQQEREQAECSDLQYARRVTTFQSLLLQKLGQARTSDEFTRRPSHHGFVPSWSQDGATLSMEYRDGDWVLALVTSCEHCRKTTFWPFVSLTSLGTLVREGRLCRRWHGESLGPA